MSDDKKDKNSREFFRILYRAPENPILEIDKVKFMIIDISEGGLKFVPKKGHSFFENDLINGKVIFGMRGTLEIEGHVLRVGLRDIAIRLTEESRVPLARIMEEQRFLIQKGKL